MLHIGTLLGYCHDLRKIKRVVVVEYEIRATPVKLGQTEDQKVCFLQSNMPLIGPLSIPWCEFVLDADT